MRSMEKHAALTRLSNVISMVLKNCFMSCILIGSYLSTAFRTSAFALMRLCHAMCNGTRHHAFCTHTKNEISLYFSPEITIFLHFERSPTLALGCDGKNMRSTGHALNFSSPKPCAAKPMLKFIFGASAGVLAFVVDSGDPSTSTTFGPFSIVGCVRL